MQRRKSNCMRYDYDRNHIAREKRFPDNRSQIATWVPNPPCAYKACIRSCPKAPARTDTGSRLPSARSVPHACNGSSVAMVTSSLMKSFESSVMRGQRSPVMTSSKPFAATIAMARSRFGAATARNSNSLYESHAITIIVMACFRRRGARHEKNVVPRCPRYTGAGISQIRLDRCPAMGFREKAMGPYFAKRHCNLELRVPPISPARRKLKPTSNAING